MKFSTRHDIEAPIDFVFIRVTDFQGFERQALRRGIDVERIDDLTENGVGMRWKFDFQFRNRMRHVKAELVRMDTPSMIEIHSFSSGVDAEVTAELLALSKNRTRLKVGLQLSPRTLPSRLLIQSVKFAKSNLNERFAKRVQQFGRDIENRYAGSPATWA